MTGYITDAKWIKAARHRGDAALTFTKHFTSEKSVKKAEISLTALGVYELIINGKRASDFIFAPGWTDHFHRLQVQTADITSLLEKKNKIEINVGQGWLFHGWYDKKNVKSGQPALLAAVKLTYEDGEEEYIYTDETWGVNENQVRYNHMYNGETVDFTYIPPKPCKAAVFDYTKDILIPQEGEKIVERERFSGAKLITTPKGETVIDFGQEITGYVTFTAKGRKGSKITVKHFEMLDRKGNVYTANYRSARSQYTVVNDGNVHTVKPVYTFYGFRYIAVKGMEITDPAQFTAIAVYSDIKQTGFIKTSDDMLNKLFSNITWGQRGNFLDVPTDCPQRDERLGWTGDAQVFCKTASYNFDTAVFFRKWLGDLRTAQRDDGMIPNFVPCSAGEGGGSAAWADVACVLPWQMYLTYGETYFLTENFGMMKKWVNYMVNKAAKKHPSVGFHGSRCPYLHNDQWHFGDWLALDLPNKEAVGGATDKDLIATAFFAYSTSLLIKAGEIIGEDVGFYKQLYPNVVKAFRDEYIKADGTMKCNTQTACVLALQFDLAENREAVANQLTGLLKKSGHLTTGFVGTPYLMHVLSDIGETKLAYDLLLRTEFPSWGYTVVNGGTTMWERWNGLRPDGRFATRTMNSFNHYAYGAVGDWMYENMAGIRQKEGSCAFSDIEFRPETDERLTMVSASIETVRGTAASQWKKTENGIEYEFTVPEGSRATAVINGTTYALHIGINKITC